MLKTCTAQIKINYQTAGELVRLLDSVPAGAKVSVRTDKYYDQRDPGGVWLNFTWTEEI